LRLKIILPTLVFKIIADKPIKVEYIIVLEDH